MVPRQPKGIPTGGQFAASARAEADVALADDDPAMPTAPRYESLEELAAAGYVTDGWRRWQQGECATYAIALVDAHPHLRFAVMGRTEIGGGDASKGWMESHCFAYDDQFAYDSSGRHPMPYLGVEGQCDYTDLNADPDDYGYRDECEQADLDAALAHAERHAILTRAAVPFGGLPPESAMPDWRETEVRVEGRPFTLGQVYGGRLFHGSIHDLTDGTVLEPGRAEANHTESSADAVSITSGADIALHWARDAGGDDDRGTALFVYEIEPAGPVRAWRTMLANGGRNFRLQEGRVDAARIVRRIDLADAGGYEGALRRGQEPLPRSVAPTG